VSALTVLAQPDARPVRLLVAAACVVATLGLAWEAARITWLLWPAPESVTPPPRPLALDAAAPGASAIDPGRIVSAHLFGRAEAGAVEALAVPANVPTTTLDLTLQGILYNTDPSQSRAIIQPGNRATEVLAVGAEVAGGATVEAIHPDRVILLRQGRHEALRLPEAALSNAPVVAATEEYYDPTQAMPAQDLGALRERLLGDPALLQQLLNPEPVRDDAGELMGFRIQPSGDPQMLAATGLQAGDIVTEIDGIPLDSQTAAMEAMQRLGNASQITVTVERNGQLQQLMLDFGT
jgi:general secretion pathway protein C